MREKADLLRVLQAALAESNTSMVLLFDSLDRLTDTTLVADVILQDIRAIRVAGIGVVLVGPLSVMFGANITVADQLDYFYHQPSVDVLQDHEGRDFLLEIIRR